MAEEKALTLASGSGNDEYIDLSSALTAVNRRQYHQVSKDGTPLVYRCTISMVNSNASTDRVTVITAPNTWTTRNAVKKMSAAWKKQLHDAGIKERDMGTYSKRIRLPLASGMSTSGTGAMAGTMEPQQWNIKDSALTAAFQTYTTADGETVTYGEAGEFTRVAIPDEVGAGDSVEMNLALLGNSEAIGNNAYFGVVDEYLGSRGGVIDEPASSQQLPESENLMQTMFSSTQPSTDEVIDAVEDYQDYRPYNDGELDSSATPPTASNLQERATQHGKLAPQTPYAADSSVTSITIDAPLGLIELNGAVNKGIFDITVHSIYEM